MDEEIAQDVRDNGWSLLDVNDSSPPFVYTVGLMQTFSHPELIVFGMTSKNACNLLGGFRHFLEEGKSFREPGLHHQFLASGLPVAVRRVHPTQHQLYLGFAMGYLTRIGRFDELQAMQIFWPDKTGKFPFDVGCDEGIYRCQPRLDLTLTPSEIEEFEREYGSG